jgi:hypothetical protein
MFLRTICRRTIWYRYAEQIKAHELRTVSHPRKDGPINEKAQV